MWCRGCMRLNCRLATLQQGVYALGRAGQDLESPSWAALTAMIDVDASGQPDYVRAFQAVKRCIAALPGGNSAAPAARAFGDGGVQAGPEHLRCVYRSIDKGSLWMAPGVTVLVHK